MIENEQQPIAWIFWIGFISGIVTAIIILNVI